MASAAGDAIAAQKDVEQVAPPAKVEEKKAATVEDDVDDVPDPDEDDLDDLDGESSGAYTLEGPQLTDQLRYAR